jgi:methylglutamate dehydrogenase subunit B
MLRIPCPICGERDYTEFHYGGDAKKTRPPHGTGDLQAWHDYVFIFDNPKGPHREFWQHVFGCRQWLVLERDTAINRAGSCVLARTAADAGQSETRTYLKTSEMPHENPDGRQLEKSGEVDRVVLPP